MRSRRNNLLADLAKAPWPVGIVIGVVLFLLIHYGIPGWMASRGGPLAQAFARGANPFGMLGWFVLALCWLAALMSFLDAQKGVRDNFLSQKGVRDNFPRTRASVARVSEAHPGP